MAAGGNAGVGDFSGAAPALLSPNARYAIKTALSLTLAYLLPMAMGWPQPQTAATTVMLIAATGAASESLQKGVMRLLGTVAGAIIGLTMIALFPQERMTYLLLVSLVVALVIYLYNAYQGDSTIFMLTAVVTLMVFNGGDAEGAFLYGVDRAFMTAFGVLVYTVVASMLWPVTEENDIRGLAREVSHSLGASLELLRDENPPTEDRAEKLLAGLIASREAFTARLKAGRSDSESIKAYAAEWRTINACYRELEEIVVPGMRNRIHELPDFHRYLDNHDAAVANLGRLIQYLDDSWDKHSAPLKPGLVAVSPREAQLAQASHRTTAIVLTRAEALNQAQQRLLQLIAAVGSLVSGGGEFTASEPEPAESRFIWRDLEAGKTAVRAFVTFWVATAIWIAYNPPGGFMFVTLCTILIPLVSYTPVTPKLLIILLSFGFFFALPVYVFLLPAMTHWLQLATFIFLYALAGYLLFQGPVAIFYLLGLFTLGIQNEMSYHFNAILLIMLMFYIVCAVLVISIYVPFTSNPARLFASLRERFFSNVSHILRLLQSADRVPAARLRSRLQLSAALIAKMRAFGERIPADSYRGTSADAIARFIDACETLQGELEILAARDARARGNPLVQRARRRDSGQLLAGLSDALASAPASALDQRFDRAQREIESVEQRLDRFLKQEQGRTVLGDTLSGFYLYLNLRALLLGALFRCRDAASEINWRELRENRF